MRIRKIVAVLGKIRFAFGFGPNESPSPLYVYDRMHINVCAEESKLGSGRALWSESVWRYPYLLGVCQKIEPSPFHCCCVSPIVLRFQTKRHSIRIALPKPLLAHRARHSDAESFQVRAGARG